MKRIGFTLCTIGTVQVLHQENVLQRSLDIIVHQQPLLGTALHIDETFMVNRCKTNHGDDFSKFLIM